MSTELDQTITELDHEEWARISRDLEIHHSLFYSFWRIGRFQFTTGVETACIAFDLDGKAVQFRFNPKFWQSLNHDERIFIICHECLHIVLNHGVRLKDCENQKFGNFAADVVINHMLLTRYGFDRATLPALDNGCWFDTVFGKEWCDKHADIVSTPQTFEGVLLLLEKEAEIAGGVRFDDHSNLAEITAEQVQGAVGEAISGLSPEEKQRLVSSLKQYGTAPGGDWAKLFLEAKPKKKWETIIKQWSRKYWKPEYKDTEQWAVLNRRFVSLDSSLMLPSECEIEHESDKQIEVDFFMDTSGSCWGLHKRFFTAALSLDPKTFKINLYCFDTQVHPTSLKDQKVRGRGGTDFQCMEDYIQNGINKSKRSYPEAVFVITDGYSHIPDIEFPNRWYWFLTMNYTSAIPAGCNVYYLKDFE